MSSKASTPVVEAFDVSRTFGRNQVLRDVSLEVDPGEVHALLGPNGAGKTTLMRILAGLLEPTSGAAQVLGDEPSDPATRVRLGWIPSGDRSFYLRISGLQNLVFFGRMQGLSRREATRRATALLKAVGLEEASATRVGVYSHGMQKRLAVARGFMADPAVLLIDEATHDLDPMGVDRVRALVREATDTGTAVVWATQRLEELRYFATSVTVLVRGRVRFTGSVDELVSRATTHSYVLHVRDGRRPEDVLGELKKLTSSVGHVDPLPSTTEHYVVHLASSVVLGDYLAALSRAGFQILSCKEERSEIEKAFLAITEEAGT